ncbi:MAG: type II secretion system protein [Clostridia bacterium]|nr:type II secretion system protein [Clostridia bacterium]
MKKTQKKLGNKGFSLVELIVVIAIMAVLVGVLAPTLIKNIEKSRESKDAQNCEQLKSSVEIALQNETAYSDNVVTGGNDIITIGNDYKVTIHDKGGTTGAFTTELSGQIDTTKFALTSKKYKDAAKNGSIKINVNDKGQVSITGLPS